MANTTADKLAKLAENKAAIKSAINAKNPTTAPTDVMSQWPTAIASIPASAPAVITPLSVTANGTYTAPSGTDGYSPVTVNVQDLLNSFISNEYIAEITSTTTALRSRMFVDANVGIINLPYCTSVGLSTFESVQSREIHAPNLDNINIAFGYANNLAVYEVGNVSTVAVGYPNFLYAGRNAPVYETIDGVDIRLRMIVKNTIDSMMAISGFPWNADTRIKFECSDGFIIKKSGTWTPYRD